MNRMLVCWYATLNQLSLFLLSSVSHTRQSGRKVLLVRIPLTVTPCRSGMRPQKFQVPRQQHRELNQFGMTRSRQSSRRSAGSSLYTMAGLQALLPGPSDLFFFLLSMESLVFEFHLHRTEYTPLEPLLLYRPTLFLLVYSRAVTKPLFTPY
ncbi:abhydrolase 2 domain-containing protein [Histoplasma ohiense]|nr:abhydrolase 2 domain-containing protein [Histoplasma ohiense (nom. inval.)]